MLLVVCAAAWFGFDDEIRAKFTLLQRLTLVVHRAACSPCGWALARARVDRRAGVLVVVNGFRTRRARVGARSSRSTSRRARRGPPSTSPTARRSRRWRSRAPTAAGPRRRTPAACADRPRRDRPTLGGPRPTATRPWRRRAAGRGCPTTTDSSSPGLPAGARVTRSVPELKASAGAVIGSTASAGRGPSARSAVKTCSQRWCSSTHSATPRSLAGSASVHGRARPSSCTRSPNPSSSAASPMRRPVREVEVVADAGSTPVGSCRSSSSDRVAGGQGQLEVLDRVADAEVGVRPAGVRRRLGRRFVAVWVTASPSAERS